MRFLRRLVTRVPVALLVSVATFGCGGGGDASVGPSSPSAPNTPVTPSPVATVELSPPSPAVLAGTATQLTATTKDAQGTVLTGRAVSWTTSNANVATVSAQRIGYHRCRGNGHDHRDERRQDWVGQRDCGGSECHAGVQRAIHDDRLQDFQYFDHSVPKEFVDNNGDYVSWWGENSLVGIDGHSGYDWQMAIGTPIRSVAPGAVTFAGLSDPFNCPLISATTQNPLVIVEHTLPAGVKVRSLYMHLSRIDVTVGQTLTEGQQVGLAGGQGCALQSHLHFEVRRVTETKTGQPTQIDPYGWSGTGADPWAVATDGAASINLWKAGQAPSLFRFVTLPLNPNPADNLFVGITEVRFQGVRDDQNPNNEYVEITRDNRFAPATLDLTGFTIKNKAGDTFTFPAGFTLTTTRTSVKVFTGAGTNSATEVYWGQSSGKWNNAAECVRFFNAAAHIHIHTYTVQHTLIRHITAYYSVS